jgi:hypothetical protein
MRALRLSLLLSAPLWLVAGAPPPGDGLPPACGPAHDGVRICMARQVCTCAFDAAGALSGRAPGWRWACDIMQGCGDDLPPSLDVPAPQPWQGPVYVTPDLGPPGTGAVSPLRRGP